MPQGRVTDTVSWMSFPLKDDWPRSLLAPAAVLGTCAVVLVSGFGPYLAALSFVVLVCALIRYFFPARYELTGDGVRLKFMGFSRKRNWKYFHNYYPHDVGVHLTPLKRPGPLDAFRGLFVRYAGNREEVLNYIAEHVETNEA